VTEERVRAVETIDKAHERGSQVLRELLAAASAETVFGEPVVAGDRTVITAAEIRAGLGFGYGLATGSRHRRRRGAETEADAASWGRGRRSRGPDGGGGGGGRAGGRPVAVITIDPDGVHVQPVMDRTKIVLTALAALGAIGVTLLRLRRASRHDS
jgi:uncharacterized spore protein YtfJ